MSIAQSSIIKIAILPIFLAVLFALGFLVATAQEQPQATAQVDQLVALDQDIKAADLGVGDPAILPGNPFYAFKGIGRTFQSFTTRDPLKKAELKIKFANEKLIEVKKLDEKGVAETSLSNAVSRYEKEMGRVKIEIEGLKEGVDKTKIEALVKTTADNQIKHHKLLGKFMAEHEAIAPDIEAAKQAAMKDFSESMAAVVDPQVLGQKFEEVAKEQKGSAFRQFKHIEVLEEVKDFVPPSAKDAIQNAITQSSKFFEEEFKSADEDQRAIFNKYIEKIGGNEVRHLEAFDAINSFTDFDKDMLEEMERGREKARERIETRMKDIKDETRKKVFVAHLEDGKMEDARIVKELENNLDPATITAVLDVKQKMEQKMREKFEGAQSRGDLDSFFQEIEDAPDVKMLEVMKEMEQIIPPDKKEFFQEMKKKAVSEMQKSLEEARKFGRLEAQLQQVSGLDPEQAEVLNEFGDEFGPQFSFFQDIQKEQAERMRERFEHFRDFAEEQPEDAAFLAKAEEFRIRIQQDPTAQAQVQQFIPQIAQDFQKFDAQREQHGFSAEDLTEKIEDAQIAIQQLASALENASTDTPGIEAAQSLLANARKHLENAQAAQTSGEPGGAAFGQAVSAFHNATNGIRKLENTGFQEERQKYFEKRDEFREQFKDLPAAERPSFEKGVPIKPPSFDDFKFERFKGAPEAGGVVPDQVFCAQVITPARHIASNACRTFPNSCLPPGWVPDSACETKGEVHKIIPQFEIPQEEKQKFFELEQKHLEEFKKHEEDRKFKKEESRKEGRVDRREDLEVIPIGRSPLEAVPSPAPTPAPTTGEHQAEQKFFEKIISPLPPATTPLPAPTSGLPGQSAPISPTPIPAPSTSVTPPPTSESSSPTK